MRHNLSPDEIFDPYFLQSIVQHATYLLRADGSAFYFWDAAGRQATLLAKHNLTEVPWDAAIPARTIDSQRPLIETLPSRPALLAVPVARHDDILGALVVADWAPQRKYDTHDVALIESLADLAASASRQTRRLARMTAQFRALHAIDIALTSSLQSDRVLDLILEKAVELVGAEHGSLRRLKVETGELVLMAHYGSGWTPEKLAYTPRLGEGIAQWVAEHRRPYLISDVQKDSRYVVLFENMRSSVAVPLLGGRRGDPEADEFLGVLLLESSRLAAFNQQDVELLDALAQEAVIVIQNAAQHQRLQLIHKRLKDEQEKRLAAEKWTVMGQAATSLAHRINNIIGMLPASASELQRTLKNIQVPEADRKWIDANIDRIKRNAGFILKLSDALFRPFKEAGPPTRLDINQLLKEALESAELSGEVELICDFAEDLPEVESSPLLLDIFLELITNALKAMEDRPLRRLRLHTRSDAQDSSRSVVVEISDSGHGISPGRMTHLWDMFQPSVNGLGFGLWWLRTFILRQGGTIECKSQEGEGATFIVRLPAT